MRPLAEFTIPTARPTSPGCCWSSIVASCSPSVASTSSTESGTGNKGLQAMVGEFAGVGFLDLWISSSSGIGVGITIGPVLLIRDGRVCTCVDATLLVRGGCDWICGGAFSVPSSLP